MMENATRLVTEIMTDIRIEIDSYEKRGNTYRALSAAPRSAPEARPASQA
jgi:hypothetical protein